MHYLRCDNVNLSVNASTCHRLNVKKVIILEAWGEKDASDVYLKFDELPC